MKQTSRANTVPLESLLTTRQVAHWLGVHEETVRRAIRGGRLKAVKVGGWRVSGTELHRVGQEGLK